MDKKLLVIICLVLTTALIIYFYKRETDNSTKIYYTIDRELINEGDSINYADNTPGAKIWRWDFGDNESSKDRSGVHYYLAPRTYTVTLKVRGTFGGRTESRTINVLPKANATANKPAECFIKGPEKPQAGKPVNFESMVHASSYQWSIENEDTRIQTDNIATYTFSTPGRHVLILKLRNPDTASSKVIYVTERENIVAPPVVKAKHPNAYPHPAQEEDIPKPSGTHEVEGQINK